MAALTSLSKVLCNYVNVMAHYNGIMAVFAIVS